MCFLSVGVLLVLCCVVLWSCVVSVAPVALLAPLRSFAWMQVGAEGLPYPFLMMFV